MRPRWRANRGIAAVVLSLSLAARAESMDMPGDAASASPAADAWCKSALAMPARPEGPGEPLLALALSGGGYRAMLFHVGTLRRLNDAGLMPRLALVSSVSGGSITAAYLAHRWRDLQFDEENRATNFVEVIEAPLRAMARTTLDIPSVLTGILPFASSAGEQVRKLDENLFHRALLADIVPGGQTDVRTARSRPLFVINATNLQTGELWQFRPTAIGGPITQWTPPGNVLLSQAVAASSGFPPFLSPLRLDLSAWGAESEWHDCNEFRDNPYGVAYRHEPGRQLPEDGATRASFRKEVQLIDGGVRDNLGIGTIEEINRLRRLGGIEIATATLISDGGTTTPLEPSPSANWLGQSLRVLHLLSDQPDEVRVASIIRAGSARLRGFGWAATAPVGCSETPPPAALQAARRRAATDPADAYAYWSIRRYPKFHLGFECPGDPRWMSDEVRELAAVPTAFRAMPDALQARLVNWGYLAAHHGLPYVDYAWPRDEVRRRWLGVCSLPYGVEVTDPAGDTPSARHARCLRLMKEEGGPEAIDASSTGAIMLMTMPRGGK